jgi:hypothetical protein
MKFNRSIISLALISALAACGGGSSSSKAPIVEPPPAPVPVKTIIAGKAIKGTLANAVVTVYKYVDGQAVKLEGADLETASIITEADGSYTITILDYDGPIKIELSVDETTTMVCDAPAGCGGVAYGETIALASVDPALVLSAMSTVGTANNGEANVNVSALTHLAAALIESDVGGVSAETIQTQSSVIANAFNIMGSITELEPTTVDNAAAVANEDNANELRYGLINAGIMAALFSGEEDASAVLSEKLAEVVEDLVDHNGAFLVNQDAADEGFELSLVEVLDGAGEAANAVAEAIAADPALADNTAIIEELEQQETNLENQSEYEEANEDENGRSEPEVEVPTEGDAITKAKAMVEDVRLFSHLFEVGSDSNTGIATEGDKYVALIGSASEMVETEAASFLLLADVTDALSEISMMVEADTIAEGTFPIDSFLSIEDAVGTITFDTETDNGGLLFTISATSGAEKIALNAAVVIADDGLSINLNLNGSIESAGAMLSLTENSFAKVNLESAISRETLEDDSYDGEVTSGELSLEVILEQKATDTVTNPVAFTGLIKTKLMPVTTLTLDEKWSFNDGTQEEFVSFTKGNKTVILPEMLTLSGGFSSLEGNLIKATFTVNIQDLENYEAPQFKYIGAPVDDVIAISTSEDKNSVTLTTSGNVIDSIYRALTFEAGEVSGDWKSTTKVSSDEETSKENNHFDYTTTRKNTTVDNMAALEFSYQRVDIAYIETATPIDDNNDGIADQFRWDAYEGESINANGELITRNGTIHERLKSDWGQLTYDSLDELLENHRLQPSSISNGAENFAFELELYYPQGIIFELENGAKINVSLDNSVKTTIADGSATSLGAHIIADAPIEDALSIQVSADSNTVTTTFGNMVSTTSYNGTSTANFTSSAQTVYGGQYSWTDTRVISTADNGMNTPELMVKRTRKDNEDFAYYDHLKIFPIDKNSDGQADEFVVYRLSGNVINDNGDLVNEEGNILTFETDGWEAGHFESYDEIIWSESPFKYILPYNPFTTANAQMAFTDNVNNRMDNLFHSYADDIGDLESEISSEDLAMLTAGSTNLFDAYITHPHSTESLENEDVFLDVSAALSLEAILGDYQVKLMLSGNRTALDDGKFDLEMSYKLPEDENMRKLIAHMKTDVEGSFSVNNSEGVLMIMNESDDSTSDVIGSIVVGSSATKVADIEDREGVIWIIYTDETSETL